MANVNIKKQYHCTYALSYHLIFVTKYRRKVLTAAMLTRLHSMLDTLVAGKGGRLVEMNGETDHIHLLVEVPPSEAPSILVNNLKTVTSRLLRKEFATELNRAYSKPVLWSRSYFVASSGGVTPEVLQNYIQHQQRPD